MARGEGFSERASEGVGVGWWRGVRGLVGKERAGTA